MFVDGMDISETAVQRAMKKYQDLKRLRFFTADLVKKRSRFDL